jgi:hypothetical protein
VPAAPPPPPATLVGNSDKEQCCIKPIAFPLNYGNEFCTFHFISSSKRLGKRLALSVANPPHLSRYPTANNVG